MADTIMPNHDPEIYFEDGNIVLSANNRENRTVYFRLHKSILVKHSPHVFGNMFAMPPPPTIAQHDGVPLVEMPDEADALRGLIALLYDPQLISVILDGDDFTSKMLGPTQLAKKYQVDWILKMVASKLQKTWPTTLEGWDEITEEQNTTVYRSMWGKWTPAWDDGILRLRHLPEPASSILLARECDTTNILPFAFYHLLACPLDPPGEDEYSPSWMNVRRDLVSPEDSRRLLLARERIGKWFSGQYEFWAWDHLDCGNQSCTVRASALRLSIAMSIGRNGDFLHSAKVYDDPKICPECRKDLKDQIRTLREDFADQLSYFFQLDDVAA